MKFKVDQKLKNKLGVFASKGRTSVVIVKWLERVFAWGGVGIGLLYICINSLVPGLSMVNIRGIPQKNYFIIFMFGTTIIACSLTIGIILHFLRRNLESMNTNERVDESLEIKDGYLIYSYRIKYHSLPSERAVFVVALDKIRKIECYENEKKLLFLGKIKKKCVDSLKILGEISIDETEESEMILYNYFSPSLISTLESFQVNIQYF